ncbi:hypothetical protein [Undibacterium sp. Ji49W]|uniref:hypothetical protein n=1 Tax=Undibacterium sp. Ji49W TaxID=3413040 RepID=UPI003BF0F7C5
MDDYYKAKFLPDLTHFALKIALAYVYLVDVLPFLFGYLTERGGSEVKSVDDTMSGWFFCLMCYPGVIVLFMQFDTVRLRQTLFEHHPWAKQYLLL